MVKNRLLIKLLTVFLLFLFFGIGISPIIVGVSRTMAADKDLFKYTLEVHGIKGIEEYTVMLSREQVTELELLIKNINTELKNTETMEESIKIFKKATLEMDEIGLLPDGITAEQAQQLINPSNANTGEKNLQDESDGEIQEELFSFGNNENYDCLIVGRTRRTVFSDDLTLIAFGWRDFYLETGNTYFSPASGQIITFGSNGYVRWHGSFYGQLYTVSIWGPIYWRYLHVGLEGFYGFKWSRIFITIMFGTASHVALGSEPLGFKTGMGTQYKNQISQSQMNEFDTKISNSLNKPTSSPMLIISIEQFPLLARLRI